MLLAPLRVRNFALLWAGQAVSLLGNGVFTVALSWEALSLGGARGLSLVLVATFVPSTALLLAGGVVSDRRSRRTTMLACDAVQAVSVGVLAVLVALDATRLWHLVVAGAVAGGAQGFFLPASTALLPDVVPRELLVAANSLNTVSRLTAGRLAGPVLGGLLVAAGGTGVAFGVDAVTFVVSAVSLALLRPSPRAGPPVRQSALREAREGVAYCLSRRWLRVSLAAFAVLNLAVSAPLAVLVPVYVREHLGLGAGALGLLVAVEGVGGGLAAVVASAAPSPRRRVVATHVSFALAGGTLALLGVTAALGVAVACLAVAGFLLEIGNVHWATALQENVPGDILGRVSSFDWLVSGSLLPAGMAVVGALAPVVSVGAVFAAGGVTTLVASGAAAWRLRRSDGAGRDAVDGDVLPGRADDLDAQRPRTRRAEERDRDHRA